MALQDKFKKRGTEQLEAAKLVPINLPPTLADLRFCMEKARMQTNRPVALSWRMAPDTYVLTATLAPGTYDPTWILHVGSESNSAIMWTYSSADSELIYSFLPIHDKLTTDAPKAEIPESLRPKAVVEVEEEKDGPYLPLDEFADKCEVMSQLGFGGMGVIYKARRKDNQQIVALKVLHGHLLDDSEISARFMQEASACLELRHRNLIKVHEYGVSKRGKPYMIMEYLEGQSLTDIIQERGHLEIPQFINLFTQVCDGLQFAHEKGVVHRDVKPSNIMVVSTEGGGEWAKVLDFGIAKGIVDAERKLTPTGNVVGSPAYISPEQCAGAKADPRIDVYSLGCMMYEALSGRPPFMHESPIKVILMQLETAPPLLSSVCPEGIVVPADIESLIMRCLEKDPDARFSSAAELGAELWAIAARRSRGITGLSATAYDESASAGEEKATYTEAIPRADATTRNQSSADSTTSGADDDLLSPAAKSWAISASSKVERENPVMPITVRMRRCRIFAEMDGVWEGLLLAEKILAKGRSVSILLEADSVILVMRPDAYRFNLDEQTQKMLSTMQSKLLQLIKSGASVFASERWVKRSNNSQPLMPGVKLLVDDEICDLIIERSGSIIDY